MQTYDFLTTKFCIKFNVVNYTRPNLQVSFVYSCDIEYCCSSAKDGGTLFQLQNCIIGCNVIQKLEKTVVQCEEVLYIDY